jgi:hypothetical protein
MQCPLETLSVTVTIEFPLDQLPPPPAIHERIGRLYRELALLRRLLRISKAAWYEREHECRGRRESANAS